MNNELLRVERLRVSIRTPSATAYPVRDLSFHLPAGRALMIAGESGSGKTTAAYAMLGHLSDQRDHRVTGSVWLDNIPVLDAPLPVRRSLWGHGAFMIVQNAVNALNPTMRAGHQICDILQSYGGLSRSEAKARCLALLSQLEIDSPARVFSAYPHALSGGMCQRVMIGMALAFSSRLIVADEPTTALDAVTAADTLKLLLKTGRRSDSSLVIISHDLETVSSWVDDILVMYAGTWVEKGTRQALLSAPAHPYTKALIDAGQYPLTAALGEIPALEGIAPSVFAQVPGCAFAARCPHAMCICARELPPECRLSQTHTVRCHLFALRQADPEVTAIG